MAHQPLTNQQVWELISKGVHPHDRWHIRDGRFVAKKIPNRHHDPALDYDSATNHVAITFLHNDMNEVFRTDVKIHLLPSEVREKSRFNDEVVTVTIVDFNIPVDSRDPLFQHRTEKVWLETIRKWYGGDKKVDLMPSNEIEFRGRKVTGLRRFHQQFGSNVKWESLPWIITW